MAPGRPVRRDREQCRPQVGPLPLRREKQRLGDRPRPHIPRRREAADGDLGLRGAGAARRPLRRRGTCAGRAGARRAGRDHARADQPGRDPRPEKTRARRAGPSLALPRPFLSLVDSLAARVTKRTLVSFPRFMRLLGSLRFGPPFLILAALASASFLMALAPVAR